MQKHTIALAVAVVAAVHAAGAQKASEPPIRRIAIGMQQGERLPPYAVDATSEGWIEVFVYPVQDWVQIGQPSFPPPMAPPNTRIVLDPASVHAFTSSLRSALAQRPDSTNPVKTHSMTLGHGASRVEVIANLVSGKLALSSTFRLCNAIAPGGGVPTAADLLELAKMLDSAVVVAKRQRREPLLPTLRRPYSAAEVSCAARFALGRRLGPLPGIPGGTFVPVQFVVDTAGFVEPNSVEFIASTPSVVVDSVRQILAHTRNTPAEVDGTPVRGMIQTSLVFESLSGGAAPQMPMPLSALILTPRPDSLGWVRIEAFSPGFGGAKEWVSPDSVDAFVARVRAINENAAAFARDIAPRDSLRSFSQMTIVGQPGGNAYTPAASVRGKSKSYSATWIGCGRLSYGAGPGPSEQLLQTFGQAASAARAIHSTPVSFAAMVFGPDDVSCPAALSLNHSTRADFMRAWMYPMGILPQDSPLAGRDVDVLASFVVDSVGTPDPSTIELIAGSDQSLLEFAKMTLPTLHFRAAWRGGIPVKQRVAQILRVTAAVACGSSGAGPTCPRRYREP